MRIGCRGHVVRRPAGGGLRPGDQAPAVAGGARYQSGHVRRWREPGRAWRTRAERADLHLDLIAYGPARHLVSAAVRHLLANQYEECLHAIQLAGALYEYSNASDYDLKEYWEIVGLAYRGLGDEREMDNAFILARLSDSSLQRPPSTDPPEEPPQ